MHFQPMYCLLAQRNFPKVSAGQNQEKKQTQVKVSGIQLKHKVNTSNKNTLQSIRGQVR